MRSSVFCGVVILCVAAAGASAQVTKQGRGPGTIPPVTDMPAETGSTKPSAAPQTGRVKPPGSPLGQDGGMSADLERRQREMDRRIRNGICRGC